MDFKNLYNPYDFANPILDSQLFVGREEEMSDIIYYLDHAKSAQRPISLAIIGKRAAGKTSLLNMITVEARKRDFCIVRIDLTEDDIQTQLHFFFRIFDNVFASVC